MQKVLFVIGSLQHGGAETVLVDLLNNINKDFNLDLLLINNSGPLLNNLSPNINVVYLTNGLERCNNLFSKFYNKILQSMIYRFLSKLPLFSKIIYKKLNKKYDVEIAFLAGIPCEIIKNSPNNNSKKIMWVHADVKNDGSKSYYEYLNSYKYFDSIIGVSESSIKTFVSTFPDSKNKIKLINNFIDVEKIIKKSRLEVADIKFDDKKINFLSVGRLSSVKGFDRIIKIANYYDKDIIFNIMGDGNEKEKLKNMAKSYKIKNVFLLGARTNPYPYMKKADVFLLTSRSEAYPTVIIEAMVLNKFIIATDVSGVREILKNYKYKIIVENSEKGIIVGIKEYLKNKAKLINEKSSNSEFISQNSNNLKKVVDLLNEKEA